MNDPLMWFWLGCALMLLFWVAVFYRQRYVYRTKRLKMVSRFRTWLQIKRMIIETNYGVAKSMNLRITNVERNSHQWEETCKALKKEVEEKRDRNRFLEHRNEFLERKCKAISTIINTGFDITPVPMNETKNCIHCRQLGLSYCISEVLHGKKTAQEKHMPPNATATKPEYKTLDCYLKTRLFEQPTVDLNTCSVCKAMGLPFCICMMPKYKPNPEMAWFGKGIEAMAEAEKAKQGGSDAGTKQEERRSSGDR